VYDSFRLKTDEAQCVCLVAPLAFHGGSLSAHSRLVLSTGLNKLVFFFADDQN